MSLFPDTPDIFKDDTPLNPNYQREFFVKRDGPMTKLANNIAPVQKGRSPGNIVLHGGPGTGKSTTTRHIFDQLNQEMPNDDLSTIYAEMTEGDTAYQALIGVLNEIQSLQGKEVVTQTGHSHTDVRKMLFDALDEFEGVLLIALDDAHLLAEPDKLFNDLSRARQRSGVSVRIGLILIANNASFLDDLSSDTNSTLRPKDISFPKYKQDKLRKIIQKRSEEAFLEDTVSGSILQYCAALSAREGGDARYGINLLKEAGEQACIRLRDQNDPPEDEKGITNADVRRADENLENSWFANAVAGLSSRGNRLFFVAAQLACAGKTPCRTSDFHRQYNEFSEETISKRSLRDLLANLATQALLIRNDRNQGAKRDGTGGQYYEYELGEELVPVLRALKGIDIKYTSEDAVEDLCEVAMKHKLLTNTERDIIMEQ